MMRRALVTFLAVLIPPIEVQAHAQLRNAEPVAGSILDSAPAEVVLTFNESIGALQARLFRPDGSAVEMEARAEGPRLIVPMPDGLSEVTHALSWRVMSDDGHPVGSTHVFSHRLRDWRARGRPEPVPRSAAVARGLLTVTLVMGVGDMVWAVLSETPAPRVTAAALWAIVPTTIALNATHAMDMTGAGPAPLLSGEAWAMVLGSPVGPAAVFAVGVSLLALSKRKWPVLLAWGLAALAFASAGHAARAEPMVPLVFVHAMALIFWAGALPRLLLALRRPDAEALMLRFSRIALPMVAALVVLGGVLEWRQIEAVSALTSTTYGWIYFGKMGLIPCVLALAGYHKLRLTPLLASDGALARMRFNRSLWLEPGLMVLILALTAGFRLTPPPRAMAEIAEARAEVHLHGRETMADIVLIPGRPGQNTVEIVTLYRDFRTFRPIEVTLFFSMPEAGLKRLEARAEMGEDGIWTAGAIHLPQAESWDIVADILITDFRKELIGGEISLLP
ncbi:MAG: hypothetical protein EA407_04045 [Rhodobacteraceae bacterium]|nr:MAG: hypothetical protein EA407_04045 [Paracoccaceae bacterium]